MPFYRRRTARRRTGPRRRRTRRYRRRVPRKYSGDGKRFFKLTTTDAVTSTAGGIILNTYTDNPTGYSDFTNLQTLFDSYRVCAIKIRFIPTRPNDESNLTTYAAAYIVHDPDSTTPPATTAEMVEYENVKIKNLYSQWSYYRKFRRTTSTGVAGQVVLAGGYKDMGLPTGTQAVFIRTDTGLLTSTVYGRYITTLYITCKNRR